MIIQMQFKINEVFVCPSKKQSTVFLHTLQPKRFMSLNFQVYDYGHVKLWGNWRDWKEAVPSQWCRDMKPMDFDTNADMQNSHFTKKYWIWMWIRVSCSWLSVCDVFSDFQLEHFTYAIYSWIYTKLGSLY